MISLKDIAKSLGVSPASVSFVLNGKAKQKRISDDLANRITEAAEAMGYQPNRIAVGLRTGKSNTIGLIVEDISNHFFSTLAKTIEDEARKFGYNVVYCSTENDAVKGHEMIQMLNNQQVDGYLITAASGMEEDINKLREFKKPVVLIDRYFKSLNVPYVGVDNYEGMLKGMEYIIGKGTKKIGYITVDMDLLQMKDRENAYRDALLHNRIPYEEANILRTKYDVPKEKAVKEIRNFLKEKKFDAVVFATNYLGIYGLQSIKELKLKIPTDLSIICFDDHDIFELYTPGITVIEQPIRDMAKAAVNILINTLKHKKPAENSQILLPTNFIIRGSV